MAPRKSTTTKSTTAAPRRPMRAARTTTVASIGSTEVQTARETRAQRRNREAQEARLQADQDATKAAEAADDDSPGRTATSGSGDADDGNAGNRILGKPPNEKDKPQERSPAQSAIPRSFTYAEGHPRALGYASESRPCTYGRQADRREGWLRGLLDVFADTASPGRLAYRASFWLDEENSADSAFIAYVDSWRIDRTTDTTPKAKAGWISDFLRADLPGGDGENAALRETMICLKALYNENGGLKPAIKGGGAEIKQRLRDSGLVFIELIYVNEQYQGRGLLSSILKTYRRLLRRLPEWFAFEGMLVLVPSRPADEGIGGAWNGTDDRQVETTLINSYRNADNFVLCARNARSSDYIIPIMARGVTDDL